MSGHPPARNALLALAMRVERATGRCRVLNVEIECARPLAGHEISKRPSAVAGKVVSRYSSGSSGTWGARDVTGSIDAVKVILPDGHAFAVGNSSEDDSRPWACVTGGAPGYTDYEGSAVTPELALCAAWLRAQAGEVAA